MLLETKLLERTGGDITSTAGYAGGPARTPVCYHNLKFPARDYATLGHTEVVKVSVPEEKVGNFAKEYLDSAAWQRYATACHGYQLDSIGLRSVIKRLKFCAQVAAALPAGRPDSQDVGAEYRAAIGLPSGANSSIFQEIVAANDGRLKLAVAQGGDPDTAGIFESRQEVKA